MEQGEILYKGKVMNYAAKNFPGGNSSPWP